MESQDTIILPFLKWAGGKRWLIKQQEDLFPQKFNRYIEPFLGSGAVYFHLKPSHAILSDLNNELISTYLCLQKDWESVMKVLRTFQRKHSEAFYYKLRGQEYKDLPHKAAKFIYLNRTCWNGLYRVNLKGEFNVPIGTKQKVILDSDNFETVSAVLKNASIHNCDFEITLNKAERGDLVFVDPPYTVKHNLNGFVKYNEKIFSWDDQIRLRDNLVSCQKRGVRILMTNANHTSIKQLYKGFGKHYIMERSSIISGNAQYRGRAEELLIKTW